MNFLTEFQKLLDEFQKHLYLSNDTFLQINIFFAAILVPVFIFASKYTKFERLDRYLILDNIIKRNAFLGYIIFVFLFYVIKIKNIPVLLFLHLISLTYISFVIYKIFKWIRYDSYRDNLRKKYLENFPINSELPDIIDEILSANINTTLQIELSKIVLLKLNKIDKNIIVYRDILSAINRNLDNLNFYIKFYPIYEEKYLLDKFIEKAIALHSLDSSNKLNQSDSLYINECFHIIRKICQKITDEALQYEEYEAILTPIKNLLLEDFMNYPELKLIINDFFNILFQYIDFLSKTSDTDRLSRLFSQYPKELKFSIDTLSNNNEINNILRINVLNRIYEKITRLNGYDYILDKAISNFFDSCDYLIIAPVLIFMGSVFDPTRRVESIVKRKWWVGRIGEIKTFWDDNSGRAEIQYEREREKMKRNTFDLIEKIYPDLMKELKDILKDFNNMKDIDDEYKYNFNRLKSIFEELYDYYTNKSEKE